MGGLAWGALGFGVGGVKYEPGVFLERGLMRSCCGLCLWDLSPCLQMFPECIVRRAGSSSCICGAFPERGGKEEGKEEEEGVMWVTAVPGAGPALPLLCRGTGKRDRWEGTGKMGLELGGNGRSRSAQPKSTAPAQGPGGVGTKPRARPGQGLAAGRRGG